MFESSRVAQAGFEDSPDLLRSYGPTLHVRIGFDPSWIPGETPSLGNRFLALIDTGASDSYIDSSVAAALDLPISDRTVVGTGGGRINANRHLAQIEIPQFEWTMYGAFAGVDLRKVGGVVHDAILGRDFLRNLLMTYNGATGHVLIERLRS